MDESSVSCKCWSSGNRDVIDARDRNIPRGNIYARELLINTNIDFWYFNFYVITRGCWKPRL
jgi:hypothetical protein